MRLRTLRIEIGADARRGERRLEHLEIEAKALPERFRQPCQFRRRTENPARRDVGAGGRLREGHRRSRCFREDLGDDRFGGQVCGDRGPVHEQDLIRAMAVISTRDAERLTMRSAARSEPSATARGWWATTSAAPTALKWIAVACKPAAVKTAWMRSAVGLPKVTIKTRRPTTPAIRGSGRKSSNSRSSGTAERVAACNRTSSGSSSSVHSGSSSSRTIASSRGSETRTWVAPIPARSSSARSCLPAASVCSEGRASAFHSKRTHLRTCRLSEATCASRPSSC